MLPPRPTRRQHVSVDPLYERQEHRLAQHVKCAHWKRTKHTTRQREKWFLGTLFPRPQCVWPRAACVSQIRVTSNTTESSHVQLTVCERHPHTHTSTQPSSFVIWRSTSVSATPSSLDPSKPTSVTGLSASAHHVQLARDMANIWWNLTPGGLEATCV